jgi:hypothetical protein
MSGRFGRVEKQATMDEAYSKDHGAAQEFGFWGAISPATHTDRVMA